MMCIHCQQEQAKSNGLCGPCLEMEPDVKPIAPTEEQMEVMADDMRAKREDTHYAEHHAQGCR